MINNPISQTLTQCNTKAFMSVISYLSWWEMLESIQQLYSLFNCGDRLKCCCYHILHHHFQILDTSTESATGQNRCLLVCFHFNLGVTLTQLITQLIRLIRLNFNKCLVHLVHPLGYCCQNNFWLAKKTYTTIKSPIKTAFLSITPIPFKCATILKYRGRGRFTFWQNNHTNVTPFGEHFSLSQIVALFPSLPCQFLDPPLWSA